MFQFKRLTAAALAVVAALTMAVTASAVEPQEGDSKLLFNGNVTIGTNGIATKSYKTVGGEATVQIFYACKNQDEEDTVGNVGWKLGSPAPKILYEKVPFRDLEVGKRTLLCDGESHWIKNVSVRPGQLMRIQIQGFSKNAGNTVGLAIRQGAR